MLLIGLDEAGYGPVLGPLCHGLAVMRLASDAARAFVDPPDLYALLAPAVSRCATKSAGSIVIDDSKKVYALSKRSFKKGTHLLEAGVEAMRTCVSSADANLASTFTNLHAALKLAQLSVVALDARAMSVRDFNDGLRSIGNKADVNWSGISSQFRDFLKQALPAEPLDVVIDRQGGRKFYLPKLQELFPAAMIWIEKETARESVYQLEHEGHAIRVSFLVEADGQSFCVALASMAAKLKREQIMEALNDFYKQHLPEIHPTAGYYVDAQRFLKETKILRKQLGIADVDFVRTK